MTGAIPYAMDNSDYSIAIQASEPVRLRFGVAMIRVLIVGDQSAVRRGLHMRLAAEADISVIGEAADCQQTMALATSLCPDVVLIDVDMPHIDGIALASALHTVCPNSSVIVLSIHDDAHICERANEAGVAAFVTKSMPAATLLAAIREVVH